MVTYNFPFAIPPKERERARCMRGKAILYSPASTKDFYRLIRGYILEHYPQYEEHKMMTDCFLTLEIGVIPKNAKNDLDNRLKNLDALNRDAAKRENSGFKGIWKDDQLIRKIHTELVFVENEEDEYTILTLEPFTPRKGSTHES